MLSNIFSPYDVFAETSFCCIYFIPLYGIAGACGALLISAVVRLLGTAAINFLAMYSMDYPINRFPRPPAAKAKA